MQMLFEINHTSQGTPAHQKLLVKVFYSVSLAVFIYW